MSVVRKIAKNLLFPVITGLRIEKIFSKFSKNKNLILCFHGVSNFPNKINNRHMSVSQFEDLIIYLKREFEIVPLHDFFLPHPGRKKRIGITFDDGYLNNYTVAWPILERHNIHATFFITTEGFEIEDYCLWPEIFDILKLVPSTEKIIFNREGFIFKNNQLVHAENGTNIFEHVKNMGEERQLFFKEFIARYDIKNKLRSIEPELVRFCNETQIMEMSQSPLIEIGSHTHRHYNLSRINEELAKQELKKSKTILENIIHKPVLSIGYPDGDYSENVKKLAEEAGYSYQLAVSFSDEKDYTDKRIRSRYSISNTTNLATNKILINRAFNKTGF